MNIYCQSLTTRHDKSQALYSVKARAAKVYCSIAGLYANAR